MKGLFGFALVVATIFLLVGLAGSMDTPEQRKARLERMTPYERCKESTTHLRSEHDKEEVMHAICDRLEYAPGDYK